jgi:hypothetical protein
MGQLRGMKADGGNAQTNGRSMPDQPVLASASEASCPDCGHPNLSHEGSLEDEFVASHGGVGYAICMEVDSRGETTDLCGCRRVIGSSLAAIEPTLSLSEEPLPSDEE